MFRVITNDSHYPTAADHLTFFTNSLYACSYFHCFLSRRHETHRSPTIIPRLGSSSVRWTFTRCPVRISKPKRLLSGEQEAICSCSPLSRRNSCWGNSAITVASKVFGLLSFIKILVSATVARNCATSLERCPGLMALFLSFLADCADLLS